MMMAMTPSLNAARRSLPIQITLCRRWSRIFV
jgi:hypothetical protein